MNFGDIIVLLLSSLPSLFGMLFLLFLLVGIISSFIPRSKKQQNEEALRLRRNLDALNAKIHEQEREIAKCKDIIQSYIDRTNADYLDKMQTIDHRVEVTMSNLTALPYMASIIADFETRELEILAKKLEWGHNQERTKKVKSIRELRKETDSLLSQYKEAQYQLDYAVKMFPALEDFLSTDYRDIDPVQLSLEDDNSHDRVLNYLSREEYESLPSVQRNQLALDRYRESHRKSNWQIGRDYELYVGYKYETKGYVVDYYGAVNKLEDLGRDLIAKRGDTTLVIQCKYWSTKKVIREKHIAQLYGTMTCYCFENELSLDSVHGVLVTNITLSDTAKQFAKYLRIEVVENFALGNYPCIKCNINKHSDIGMTKIYHLPFDQQYDTCQINQPGEFMAMTTAEAEDAGFRRAYRWHGN